VSRTKTPDSPSSTTATPDGSSDGAEADVQGGASMSAYARAGVDLDHDESFVDEIKEIARTTTRPEVLTGIGGFAGVFKAPDRYTDPVFVAATDGVGTKLTLAHQIGRFDTIGIDCVAMVVNDLIVQGAEPVVFLDYLAMSRLEKKIAAEALQGVAEGCRRAGCALLGGETATMPGVYRDGEVELVGFAVGVVDRDKVIEGSMIREGDTLIGIASSGFHSNGYSLVRHVVEEGIQAGKVDLFGEVPELNTSLASALLAPTRIYVKPILNVIRDFEVHGIVHVTGGGFSGNVPRILPQGVLARIDPLAWPRPGVFPWIQRMAELPDDEMLRVFNCGIGMILAVPEDQFPDVIQRLQSMGERAYRIGRVERTPTGTPSDGTQPESLVIDPGFLTEA
jgi:phosphoribosylformylglycinamidine cyclo-ligase